MSTLFLPLERTAPEGQAIIDAARAYVEANKMQIDTATNPYLTDDLRADLVRIVQRNYATLEAAVLADLAARP